MTGTVFFSYTRTKEMNAQIAICIVLLIVIVGVGALWMGGRERMAGPLDPMPVAWTAAAVCGPTSGCCPAGAKNGDLCCGRDWRGRPKWSTCRDGIACYPRMQCGN